MLVRFTVENFMSFRDKTEFNMLTGDVRRHKHHVTEIGGVELLRAAAIYGANGSGKSNLVKAMATFNDFIAHSEKVTETDFTAKEYFFKLQDGMETKPTEFIAEFASDESFFEFGIRIHKNIILKEWLRIVTPSEKDSSKEIYTRETTAEGSTSLSLASEISSEQDRIRFNLIAQDFKEFDTLILQKLVSKGIKQIDEFRAIVSKFICYPKPIFSLTENGLILHTIHDWPEILEFINELIKVADIGIKELVIKKIPLKEYLGENEKHKIQIIEAEIKKGKKTYDLSNKYTSSIAVKEGEELFAKTLVFFHNTNDGKSSEFSIWNESEGTLTYLAALMMIGLIKFVRGTIVLDEIEKSMHPLLITEMIKKFMNEKDIKGQLIFTTHETRLLDLKMFRQDEVWFTEKGKDGATKIYPLSDYAIRADLEIENGYLNGRFGGIPFLGKLEDLDWNTTKEKKDELS